MLLVVSEPSAIVSGSRVAEVHQIKIAHISNHHVEQSLSYMKKVLIYEEFCTDSLRK